ncbi:hypothetical protein VTK73DRAFT_1061 [Phialemonium thermophilum]|uniref:Uncharacterized protein n=1 Tax=Phialemonium thermophilum TaxID=223376 RepID=A0ABR3VU02_9PEZI
MPTSQTKARQKRNPKKQYRSSCWSSTAILSALHLPCHCTEAPFAVSCLILKIIDWFFLARHASLFHGNNHLFPSQQCLE